MDPTEKTAWITFAGMLAMALIPAFATLLVAYLQRRTVSKKKSRETRRAREAGRRQRPKETVPPRSGANQETKTPTDKEAEGPKRAPCRGPSRTSSPSSHSAGSGLVAR